MRTVSPQTQRAKTTPKWQQRENQGKKNGPHATFFMMNGDKYTGEWRNNLKHGKGTYLYAKDGSVYEGEWAQDKRCGYGTFSVQHYDPAGRLLGLRKIYAGDWADDLYSGHGLAYYDDESWYEGAWRDSMQNGWGTMHYADGKRCALIDGGINGVCRYDGEWLSGKRHENGDKYEGMWFNDLKEGPGRFIYRSKRQVYEGEWAQGVPKCGTIIDLPPPPRGVRVTKHYLPQLYLADSEAIVDHERQTVVEERLCRLTDTVEPVSAASTVQQ